jgi:hypothetical protein
MNVNYLINRQNYFCQFNFNGAAEKRQPLMFTLQQTDFLASFHQPHEIYQVKVYLKTLRTITPETKCSAYGL